MLHMQPPATGAVTGRPNLGMPADEMHAHCSLLVSLKGPYTFVWMQLETALSNHGFRPEFMENGIKSPSLCNWSQGVRQLGPDAGTLWHRHNALAAS